ncbi:MAG: hypothetical protein QME28_09505 [Candidatus Saccharicenans sp.]|nr:hypothetical protein [Candidatus Saccharicenans sp.]
MRFIKLRCGKLLSSFLLAVFLFSFPLISPSAASPSMNHLVFTRLIKPAPAHPEEGVLLRYKRTVGDLITYKQIFYADRQIALNRPESYKLRIEWTVKAATLAEKNGRYLLAIQYNREQARLLNQKELEGVLSSEQIFDLLVEQTDFDLQSTRVVEVDALGRNLNHSYYYNEMFSGLHPLATRLFTLPENPVYPGMTYEIEAEEPVTITYKGLIPWVTGEVHIFEGQVAGGRIRASFFKDSGLLESLEYTGEYLVDFKLVKENYLFSFINRQKMSLNEMLADEQINKAVVHAALRREAHKVPASVISSFLESHDKSKRRLAAAYCALRGIPEGLNIRPYLSDSDPVVRYNAVKAMTLQTHNNSLMKSIALDSSDPLRDRARNFLERSSYFVPDPYRQDFRSLRDYIYGQEDKKFETSIGLDRLQMLLKYMKPESEYLGGFYKKIITNPVTGKIQPYFIYLPVDYDPYEVYPAVIYFGGGDGRGDQALTEAYQQLMKSDEIAGYILVTPQAEGMWWEEASAEGFVRMFNELLRTYNVDTDRLYAAGTSNGAMATFFYGTHLADRFAAIFSNMGYPVVKHSPPETPRDSEVLKNLKHTPVYIVHGDSDTMVFPVGSQKAYQILRRLKYDVRYEEFPGRDHDIKISELRGKIIRWFREKVRNAVPGQIEYVINDEQFNQHYWIRVDKVKALPAEISATVDESKNEIRIRSRNVESLTVFCGDRMLDLSREIKIYHNNKLVFSGLVQPTPAELLEVARERLDPSLTFEASIRIEVD